MVTSAFELTPSLMGWALPAGAVAGFLAGLFGLGGGIIMLPALIALLDAAHYPMQYLPHAALGSSLASIVGIGSLSAWQHWRQQNIHPQVIRQLAPGIIIGALLAGWWVAIWSAQTLQIIYLLLCVSLLWQLVHPHSHTPLPPQPLRLPGATGVIIGLLSGWLGIGGGTLTTPYLLRHGIPLRKTIGSSAVLGVPLALAAASIYAIKHGWVIWPLSLMLFIGALPFTRLGARYAQRWPETCLRRGLILLILLIMLRTIWRLFYPAI
jgi:uncharacterized protein